jgi:hypothetical protein
MPVILAFGVWVVWAIATEFLEFPTWVWRSLAVVLGIGAEILVDWDRWWLGIGIGGLAVVLMLLTDLVLVTTDWVRVAVLRQARNRR